MDEVDGERRGRRGIKGRSEGGGVEVRLGDGLKNNWEERRKARMGR